MKSEARGFLDLIKQTKAPTFTVEEKLDESATVAEILMPKTNPAPAYNKKGRKLRRTGRKAPDVVLDVYMGVLESKPRITELN